MRANIVGVMESWSVGQRKRRTYSETQHSITPVLHYSKLARTYAASASRHSRIGGKPNSSETKQRNGV